MARNRFLKAVSLIIYMTIDQHVAISRKGYLFLISTRLKIKSLMKKYQSVFFLLFITVLHASSQNGSKDQRIQNDFQNH